MIFYKICLNKNMNFYEFLFQMNAHNICHTIFYEFFENMIPVHLNKENEKKKYRAI